MAGRLISTAMSLCSMPSAHVFYIAWLAYIFIWVGVTGLELTDSDLVLVRGTCTKRLQLAHTTGRAARSSANLRTVYVLEDQVLAESLQTRFGKSMNETYIAWPDRPDKKKPGDSRVAIAPWLAHNVLGDTYKWFLYGDDDNLFFVDSVKRLLAKYDPELPYVVTDVIWHKRKRYLTKAPRCLPCHISDSFLKGVAARQATQPAPLHPDGRPLEWRAPPFPPRGCPCTPQLACEFTLNVTGKREALNRSSPLAWSPESKYWGFPPDYPHFHGGSGVLVSVGAMRKVQFKDALKCFYDDVKKLTAKPDTLKSDAHCDRMASLCFWQHGVALADPGLGLSYSERSYVGGRVMDNRTANVAVLQRLAQISMPEIWYKSVLHMVAAHVGHHPTSLEWYPQAVKAAVRAVRAEGV